MSWPLAIVHPASVHWLRPHYEYNFSRVWSVLHLAAEGVTLIHNDFLQRTVLILVLDNKN